MKIRTSVFLWILYDLIALSFCVVISAFIGLNFDSGTFGKLVDTRMLPVILTVIVPNITLLFLTKCYKVLWQFASAVDFIWLCCSPVISWIFMFVCGLLIPGLRMRANVYVIFLMLSCVAIVAPRVFLKIVSKLSATHAARSTAKTRKVMIIGAGEAAGILISDIARNESFSKSTVVCAIDDDETKIGKYINGVKIVGTRHDIVSSAKKYYVDVIVFAIPSMPLNERREILEICSVTGCELKTMPSIDDALNRNSKQMSISNVKIEDLLERMPIKLDMTEKMQYVTGKVVLVTGGGGSIGSELCRQIVRHSPKLLIIFDVYENNAYDILNELRADYPEANIIALIGSVRDSHRMECVFRDYRPQIVYHAAAHKHVPLMEDSPNEAIKNNVFGTFKTADMADKYGVERFVLISTDKAVNPTNVMGASKRICEMIVQSFSKHSKTEFVAVRFGNVLGSNGSVIPLFKKQIEQGGPVKVTHPDIIRYFMTIPEAVSLVLTAGAMAKGGEIFVLDMGKPVKIVNLAKNMIRLMGYQVDKDIKIEFVGLRPGEKLYEEKLMSEEGLESTENHLIHVGKPIEFDEAEFLKKLEELKQVMYDDSCDIRNIIHEIVPTYKESEVI